VYFEYFHTVYQLNAPTVTNINVTLLRQLHSHSGEANKRPTDREFYRPSWKFQSIHYNYSSILLLLAVVV